MKLHHLMPINLLLLVKYVRGAANGGAIASSSKKQSNRQLSGKYQGTGECDKLPGLKGFEVQLEEAGKGLKADIIAKGDGWILPMRKPGQLTELKYRTIGSGFRRANGLKNSRFFRFERSNDKERRCGSYLFIRTLYDKLGFFSLRRKFGNEILMAETSNGIMIGLHPTRSMSGKRYIGRINDVMCKFHLSKVDSTTTLTSPSTILSHPEKLVSVGKRKASTETSEINEEGNKKKQKTTWPADFLPDGLYETNNVWNHPDKAVVDVSSESGAIFTSITFYGSDGVSLPQTELEQRENCMYSKTLPNVASKTIKFIYVEVSPNWSNLRICKRPDGGWELQMLDSVTNLPYQSLKLEKAS